MAEVGSRPLISTPSRLNAPAGAQVLADVLHELDFADDCLLTLDWDRGALAISATKSYPEIKRRADIDFIVDIEDAFTKDNFGLDVAREIMDHLRSEFQKKDDESKRMIGRA